MDVCLTRLSCTLLCDEFSVSEASVQTQTHKTHTIVCICVVWICVVCICISQMVRICVSGAFVCHVSVSCVHLYPINLCHLHLSCMRLRVMHLYRVCICVLCASMSHQPVTNDSVLVHICFIKHI